MFIKQFTASRDGFRRLSWQKGTHYFKRWFLHVAQVIVSSIKPVDLQPTSEVGIRTQMYNMQKGKLEIDFLIEQGQNSSIILDAISPAWPSTFPFVRHVCGHQIP
jgi:hypothetical protein